MNRMFLVEPNEYCEPGLGNLPLFLLLEVLVFAGLRLQFASVDYTFFNVQKDVMTINWANWQLIIHT